jgi:hypothetical protein
MNLTKANQWVARHHSHNDVVQGHLFSVGCEIGGQLVGVGIAGRPLARKLDDGATVEITRCCVAGHERNAASMIYGALCRAARALGYRRAFTYTLEDEPASCVRAAGFAKDAELACRHSWSVPSRRRITVDLFGNETRPTGPKVRWVRQLAALDSPPQEPPK